MLTPDDFQYALENTRVVLAPEKRLETFGTSVLNYYLVTEEMDAVNLSRVREGSILAERPQIISPESFAKLMLEGFGDQARNYAEQISQHGQQMAFLKYGFTVKKSDIRSYDVHDNMEVVCGRVAEQVRGKQDPLAAVLAGVDDGWEVCLLKFMLDMVSASGPRNSKDLRDHGLL